ncbi:MAG: class I SAM-dependent methyltransferase [Elusimicrobia bacterium]|nr:class I SAM-dependent methyltransferase [Elusimicrobiota bacterium]
MQDTIVRRKTCRLCDGKDLKAVLELAPSPLADSYIPQSRLSEPQELYPMDLYLCGTCGFSQMLDVVQPQAIYFDYIYETKSSLGLVEHFGRYCDEVVKRIGLKPGSLVVDLGSNDGSLLSFFKKKGMKVLGIDPAREIARKATESGVETWAELFGSKLAEKIKREKGAAALITANNLYANVDDLFDITDGIKKLLAPDGVFVFETFYLADLMENMVFDFIYHEHISYFSAKPLKAFFAGRGMELVDAQRVPTKGGSVRYTAQLAGGPRKASPAVAELIAHEERLGIQTAESFKKFNARIDAAKNKLVSLLRELRAKGKTLAGFGASPTTTTLIYHYGITDMFDYIVDDNAQRHNLFSPGKHIPVLPPETLYERKPDYVVILAWRYAEPIMAKLGRYKAQGGRFIVPLPEVKVI